MYKYLFSCLLVMIGLIPGLVAQQPAKPMSSDRSEAFFPVYGKPTGSDRLADGRPGAGYWQNRTDYRIKASFDTLTRRLEGEEVLTYCNRSPHALPYIWLALDQNRFRKDSRISRTTPLKGTRFGTAEYTEGYAFKEVRLLSMGAKSKLVKGGAHAGPGAGRDDMPKQFSYEVRDLYMKVELPGGLLPGDSCRILLRYGFTLPENGSDMLGVLATPDGQVFECSTWYPRTVPYDELRGWNIDACDLPISEPGGLDCELTVPAGVVVAGCGRLCNPEEVLTAGELKRYRSAMRSEKTVMIRGKEDIVRMGKADGGKMQGGMQSNGRVTWHFSGDHISMGMWAISASFMWDAAKMNLGGRKDVLAMSLYPASVAKSGWGGATQLIRKTAEAYSRQWCDYPFPVAAAVGGLAAGLAGSGVFYIAADAGTGMSGLDARINHEIGHAWFPYIVSSVDPYPWMEEGFTSFINDINGDSLGVQTAFDHVTATGWVGQKTAYPPLMTPYPMVVNGPFAMVGYVKPTIALRILRNDIIGVGAFDEAFRGFIKAWAYRRPTSEDFFRYMENSTGQDLSWFWRSWFFNDWKLDHAVRSVKYTGGDCSKGVNITIANNDKMVMPVVVEIRQLNGMVERVQVPAQVWLDKSTWTFHYPSTSAVSVLLDPDGHFPDQDRSNDQWDGDGSHKAVPEGLTGEAVAEHYLDAIGGRERLLRLQRMVWELGDTTRIGGYYMRMNYSGKDSTVVESGLAVMQAPLERIRLRDTLVQYRMNGVEVPVEPTAAAGIRCLMQPYGMIPVSELEWNKAGYRVYLEDSTSQVNGLDAYIVNVTNPAGDHWRYYYDRMSWLKVRQERVGAEAPGMPAGPMDYFDYRSERGLLLPHSLIQNGQGDRRVMRTMKIVVE